MGIGLVSDFLDYWQSFGQAVQTHFQWEQNFSKDRKYIFSKEKGKSHISQHPSGNPAPNRGWKLYDMIKVIHDYVVPVIKNQCHGKVSPFWSLGSA